jgi:hypothetical protein
MKHRETERTVVTLANASELVILVAQNIVGNEVADTFNGNPLSRDLIHNLAQTTFQGALSTHLGS